MRYTAAKTSSFYPYSSNTKMRLSCYFCFMGWSLLWGSPIDISLHRGPMKHADHPEFCPKQQQRNYHHRQEESPGTGLWQTQTVTKSRPAESSGLKSMAQGASGFRTKAQARIPFPNCSLLGLEPSSVPGVVAQEVIQVSGFDHSANCFIRLEEFF